jgi:hypothetical protein
MEQVAVHSMQLGCDGVKMYMPCELGVEVDLKVFQ